MPAEPSIHFNCDYCLKPLVAAAVDCGRIFKCSNCQSEVIVPSRSLDLSMFNDIFELPVANSSSADDLLETKVDSEALPPVSTQLLNEVLPDAETDFDDAAKSSPQRTEKPPTTTDNSTTQAPAPLKLDGLEDTDFATTFGVKCSVCDTRIHVSESKLGADVECPICFTPVRVARVERKTKSNPRPLIAPPISGQSSTRKMFGGEDDELKLSPPVNRPPQEVFVDPSFGFAPVSDDLLAPLPLPTEADSGGDGFDVEDDSDIPMLEVVEREEVEGLPPLRPEPLARREPSRRELYEAAQRKLDGQEQKVSKKRQPKSVQGAKPANVTSLRRPAQSSQSNRSDRAANQQNVSSFEFPEYVQLVVDMLGSPGLAWRLAVSALMIGLGSGIGHAVSGSYRQLEDPEFGQWVWSTLLWIGFSGVPYLIGTLMLWFVCGYLFRETANGNRQVSEWTAAGTADLQSTFLIFSFAFFVAGLPLVFFWILVMPLRCLFAPPLLLSAWFHQQPFAIVAVDAFVNSARDWKQWRALYLFLLSLTVVSLLAGLLMIVNLFILSFVTSLVGAIMMTLVTVAFASATGWHCGQVVRGLD